LIEDELASRGETISRTKEGGRFVFFGEGIEDPRVLQLACVCVEPLSDVRGR